MSCVAVAPSGKVFEHVIISDKDPEWLNGFEDGMKARYKEQGDTVMVSCKHQW